MNIQVQLNIRIIILLAFLSGPAEYYTNSLYAQTVRATAQKEIRLIGPSNSVISLRPATGVNSYSLVMPSAAPLANQVLGVSAVSTGTATLNWTTIAGASGNGTSGQVVYWSGANSQAGSNDFFWDATNKRLGIGTTTPSEKFQINEPSNAATLASIIARGGNSLRARLSFGVKNSSGTDRGGSITSEGSLDGGIFIQGNINDQPSVTPHVYVNPSGKLLVNTTIDNGAYVLQVNGDLYAKTARFTFVNSGGYAQDLNLRSDGTLTTSTSDIRLKKNIETIANPLQKVMSLRGVTYNWKDSTAPKKMMGMIAQEVLAVVPELVFQNKLDGYYGINYGETTALLIEAIKAQQHLIEEIKRSLQIQQELLNKANEKINQLKSIELNHN